MTQKRTAILFILSLILGLTVAGSLPASAEEFSTSIKNSASDVELATKKAIRWTKRQGRKVTDENTPAKIAEDEQADVRDEAINEARKAENRAKEAE